MFNFIDYFINHTKDMESPEIYWRWAAISCLSTIMRDNIYFKWRGGLMYPNLYIVIVAISGITRKASPLKFVQKLVNLVGNTKFVGGRSSIQAVIKDLSMNYTTDNGEIVTGAACLLYSEELDSFCVQDPATVSLLTDLYDYHERWSSNLVSQKLHLKNVCVSMLAASNSTLFTNVYNDFAVTGGLLGRTLVISEERPRRRMSLFELKPDENSAMPLLNHLKKISKIKGTVNATDESMEFFTKWYHQIPEDVFTDKIGFGNRMDKHVLKVALSIAAARDDFNLLIEQEDIEQAIDLVTALRKNYKLIIVGSGISSKSKQAALVVKVILEEDGAIITRGRLIQKLFGDIDLTTLDEILLMMEHGGFLVTRMENNVVGYGLTKQALKDLAQME